MAERQAALIPSSQIPKDTQKPGTCFYLGKTQHFVISYQKRGGPGGGATGHPETAGAQTPARTGRAGSPGMGGLGRALEPQRAQVTPPSARGQRPRPRPSLLGPPVPLSGPGPLPRPQLWYPIWARLEFAEFAEAAAEPALARVGSGMSPSGRGRRFVPRSFLLPGIRQRRRGRTGRLQVPASDRGRPDLHESARCGPKRLGRRLPTPGLRAPHSFTRMFQSPLHSPWVVSFTPSYCPAPWVPVTMAAAFMLMTDPSMAVSILMTDPTMAVSILMTDPSTAVSVLMTDPTTAVFILH
ncbi:PREDICTED: uncharacterized protein LOC103599489 [Galeopterus variegatus]|uniref:Uncharacterized protein LOC103599489 n=1 Tax=Galeopterus variegatus TaxID=482537 RepID=A0ABM0RML5_GALVR|nr:PREDICTED: uncharacterized protein LOC103599489 [Galeopterus variegatus]